MATLATGLVGFINDMGTLPLGVKLWASAFPFPQLIVAGYMTLTRGLNSPAGWVFASRVASFVVAGQINLRSPFSKAMGPIMHAPFYIVIPLCVQWLGTDAARADPNMASFITYTSVITSISLVLDGITAVKWLVTGNPGSFKRGSEENRKYDFILLIPSLLMTSFALLRNG
mmetsp:Transcript_315/g.444  ORF Transcript_315/g.444 Transcript_315/m.444 type:complete len:172 (+) Transcript_315:85-600(+)